ncbi:MAG: molybdopterin-dependent oxidoreductase [Myxococcota bacterium]
MSDTSRREFLQTMGAGALALVGVRFLAGCEGVDFESKIAGRPVDFLTSAEDGVWYFQSGNDDPKSASPSISRDEWSLSVENESETLGELNFADIEGYSDQEIIYWKTMRCVTNQSFGGPVTSFIANGLFTGIPLAAVLEDLGAAQTAAKLRTFGRDGFRSNLPYARVMDTPPEQQPVILAYELNGEPLSALRGGPVRLIIPEMWGYKNVKWLSRLEVTDDNAFFGDYETEVFNPEVNQEATPEQQELIDDPGKLNLGTIVSNPPGVAASVPGPDVTIAGASYVGGGVIESVEVSLDNGPFEPARIDSKEEVLAGLTERQRELAERAAQSSDPFPWTGIWVTWTRELTDLSKGVHRIQIGATDGLGRQQRTTQANRLVVAPPVELSFEVT